MVEIISQPDSPIILAFGQLIAVLLRNSDGGNP